MTHANEHNSFISTRHLRMFEFARILSLGSQSASLLRVVLRTFAAFVRYTNLQNGFPLGPSVLRLQNQLDTRVYEHQQSRLSWLQSNERKYYDKHKTKTHFQETDATWNRVSCFREHARWHFNSKRKSSAILSEKRRMEATDHLLGSRGHPVHDRMPQCNLGIHEST